MQQRAHGRAVVGGLTGGDADADRLNNKTKRRGSR
jgi:hypothetical protein